MTEGAVHYIRDKRSDEVTFCGLPINREGLFMPHWVTDQREKATCPVCRGPFGLVGR